jgi:hypothetical protein
MRRMVVELATVPASGQALLPGGGYVVGV